MNSKTQKPHLILDKGKQVPLTAAWLKEKVQANQRIDLILTFASLNHAHLVKVIPLVNNTKMREKQVLELFSPWLPSLDLKPSTPNRLQEIRQAVRQTIGRIHWCNLHRPIQPLCKATTPPNWGQLS